MIEPSRGRTTQLTTTGPVGSIPDLDASPTLRPFLSWAGSKRRLLGQILPHIPPIEGAYVEPFLGSGAVALALRPPRAILGDVCKPLIETWQAIERNPIGVFDAATSRPLEKESYYIARSERGGGYLQRAGRFIYLNKGAFNGLYRVNLRGEFNVPWGRPKSDFIADRDNLLLVGGYLSTDGVQVRHADFAELLREAGEGDLAFVDPPYVTSHNQNGFIEYNEKIFSWADQERLAVECGAAADRGATVIATNAHHDSVIDLYDGFAVHTLERPSTLAASVAHRGRSTEALFIRRGNGDS